MQQCCEEKNAMSGGRPEWMRWIWSGGWHGGRPGLFRSPTRIPSKRKQASAAFERSCEFDYDYYVALGSRQRPYRPMPASRHVPN